MSSDKFKKRISDFFKDYEARFQDALKGNDDVDGTVKSFADAFIESNPMGVICGKNDEHFRKMIPKGNQHYREIGSREMSINSVRSTRLTDTHYMAKVFWHSVYAKKDGSETVIDFSIIYFLQDINNALKIFAYITGDEEGVLKENGVIE